MSVRFVLNGRAVEAAQVDPLISLLEWLRGQGLTGTKEGCAEGECGACAVAWITRDEHGASRYEAVNSCLIPLAAADGKELITVEGVASPDGTLHPVQSALMERGGSQCGYCTPGFVISMFCEYYRPDRDGYEPESISGNLCRCTGYRPICDAARSLGRPTPADPHLVRLRTPRAPQRGLHHEGDGHRYTRPTTLSDTLALLAEEPGAMLMAGGTDLMVYANQRYERWPALIALDAVPELQTLELSDATLSIGAAVPLARLERWLHAHELAGTALAQLLPLFASRLLRQRATVGGSLATASPIGDLAPALLALDAELTLASASGTRQVALSEFFLDYRKTTLAPGELITHIRVPRPLARAQRFYKVSKRVLDDISSVAAAFALDLDGGGKVARLRLAYGGIAPTPLRARAVEDAAQGKPWSRATFDELAGGLRSLGSPLSDHRASADYRRAMVVRLFERFFAETALTGTGRGAAP